jgi:hypothetical protein
VELAKKVRIGLDDEIFRALRMTGSAGSLGAAVGRAVGAGYANTAKGNVYVDPTGISIELPSDWGHRKG